jgi:hypothetical protein
VGQPGRQRHHNGDHDLSLPLTHAAAQIANDPRNAKERRRAAVFELFRQLHPPVALGDVGRALERPTWLTDDDVAIIDGVGGKLPVTWNDHDTIVALRVLSDLTHEGPVWTVYLRIEGKHEGRDVAACLRKGGDGGPAANATIVELALSPTP